MKETARGFLCGTAWIEEVGNTDVEVYHKADLISEAPDHGDCGVAEVELRFVRWVKKPVPIKDRATTPVRGQKRKKMAKKKRG